MGALSPTHWLIVLAVVVLLFGAKKLPDLARSVGQSTRLFKGEMRGLRAEQDAEQHADEAADTTVRTTTALPATSATETAARTPAGDRAA